MDEKTEMPREEEKPMSRAQVLAKQWENWTPKTALTNDCDAFRNEVMGIDEAIDQHQEEIHHLMSAREAAMGALARTEDALARLEPTERGYVPAGDEPAPGYPKKWPPEMESK